MSEEEEDESGEVDPHNRLGKYILVDREPVPSFNLMEWARWMQENPRHVGDTTLVEHEAFPVRISTIFLGLDQESWRSYLPTSYGEHVPVLFETMVFGGPLHHRQDRYHTYQEALAGHQAMVALVQSALEANGA